MALLSWEVAIIFYYAIHRRRPLTAPKAEIYYRKSESPNRVDRRGRRAQCWHGSSGTFFPLAVDALPLDPDRKVIGIAVLLSSSVCTSAKPSPCRGGNCVRCTVAPRGASRTEGAANWRRLLIDSTETASIRQLDRN